MNKAAAQESDLARVKVIVSDTFGRPLSGAKVTLESGAGQRFIGIGGEAAFDDIPFGQYDLEVRLMGFLARKERVRVYQSSVVFNAGVELAATHSYQRPALRGSIKAGGAGRPNLWVRLVAVYTSDLEENAVDGSGQFELDGMAVGRYLLFIFQKDKVLAMRPIDVLEGKQVFELTLDPDNGRN